MRQLDSSLSDTMAGMSVGAQHAKLLPSNSREEALAALAGGATVVAGNRRLARALREAYHAARRWSTPGQNRLNSLNRGTSGSSHGA